MNVISVTSKYLMDAITELGCWIDDDDENIKTETILPTELDGENPRVEVFIKSINE
jgi:Holliday junction resolvase RusA-like endonuclease